MKNLSTYISLLNERISSVNDYITEKLFIKKKTHNYFPKTKEELQDILKQLIKERGNEGDFNDIDTSEITDMSFLFTYMKYFNGDISEWDVSKVKYMNRTFIYCESFNQPLNDWDVSNVEDMNGMFYDCISFNQDISNWNISNIKQIYRSRIFYKCPIEEKYKPKFG